MGRLGTLTATVTHILKCDDDRAMEIVAQRLGCKEDDCEFLQELMQVDEVVECLDSKDAQVVVKQQEQVRRAATSMRCFRDECITRIREVSVVAESKAQKLKTGAPCEEEVA